MSDDHTSLDMEFDRPLLEDVLDSPDLRYVSLYMYIIRKELFQDLLDDDLLESFEMLLHLEEITVGDLTRICTSDFIKNLISFHIITNVKSYTAFEVKPDHHKIRIAKGLQIAHESLTDLEEEVHIFMTEQVLERIIAPLIPELTLSRIETALKRLRAMMCPRTAMIHPLVHKYGDFWVIDDDFFYIIEELGNPYQALRVELMIRQMSEKYGEIRSRINHLLEIFDEELPKSKMMKKFENAVIKKKSDFISYLEEKSRKKSLKVKFRLKFPDGEKPELYLNWKENLNKIIDLRLKFDQIDQDMEKLRNYYSGKNQVLSYMSFIQKTTFDEDNISSNIRDLLIEARNKLKYISAQIDNFDEKDLKILNLDLERLIIEEGLDEDDE